MMTKATPENSPWYDPGSIRQVVFEKKTRAPADHGAIDITFLADLDSSDIDHMVDSSAVRFGAVTECYSSPNAGSQPELSVLDKSKQQIKWAVWDLIELHGVDALYKALADSGRAYFRDKYFAADLGL